MAYSHNARLFVWIITILFVGFMLFTSLAPQAIAPSQTPQTDETTTTDNTTTPDSTNTAPATTDPAITPDPTI